MIFQAQFYPPPVLNAIRQHYRVAEHVCMNGFYTSWYLRAGGEGEVFR